MIPPYKLQFFYFFIFYFFILFLSITCFVLAYLSDHVLDVHAFQIMDRFWLGTLFPNLNLAPLIDHPETGCWLVYGIKYYL
jgi:hypothetical protein